MGNPGGLRPLDGPTPTDHETPGQAGSAHHARLIGELRQELEDTNRGLIALHTELENARLAETRLAVIVASSDDAMLSLDSDCRVRTWNPGAQRLLGHTEQHIAGQPVDVLMPDAARAAFRSAVEQIRSGRRAESHQCRWRRSDGTEVDVAVTVSAIRDGDGGGDGGGHGGGDGDGHGGGDGDGHGGGDGDGHGGGDGDGGGHGGGDGDGDSGRGDGDGSLIGYATTARDITHELAAQAELAVARAEREVMAERERIARDLHDMVIQRVFGAGLTLQRAAGRVPGPDADRIHTVIGELDATIRELRTTIFDLNQPVQKAASLRAQVLGETSAAHDRLGFAPAVEFTGPVDAALPDATAAHLLAVLREALSNAVRHAHASGVTVRVEAGDDLLLEVTDNGRGLDPAVTRSSGLTNMRRRADRLGGTFEITARPVGGTRLRWRIPLTADPTHGS